MKTGAVKLSELGKNCWLAERFVGGRCKRVMDCKYPEKKACKAVDSEIAHLQDKALGAQISTREDIRKLQKAKE